MNRFWTTLIAAGLMSGCAGVSPQGSGAANAVMPGTGAVQESVPETPEAESPVLDAAKLPTVDAPMAPPAHTEPPLSLTPTPYSARFDGTIPNPMAGQPVMAPGIGPIASTNGPQAGGVFSPVAVVPSVQRWGLTRYFRVRYDDHFTRLMLGRSANLLLPPSGPLDFKVLVESSNDTWTWTSTLDGDLVRIVLKTSADDPGPYLACDIPIEGTGGALPPHQHSDQPPLALTGTVLPASPLPGYGATLNTGPGEMFLYYIYQGPSVARVLAPLTGIKSCREGFESVESATLRVAEVNPRVEYLGNFHLLADIPCADCESMALPNMGAKETAIVREQNEAAGAILQDPTQGLPATQPPLRDRPKNPFTP